MEMKNATRKEIETGEEMLAEELNSLTTETTGTKCFACDRPILPGRRYLVIVWDEDQTVYVGSECYRNIKKADKQGEGWQPPKGGPKLGLIGWGSDPE
jgi:hypothetical protein